MSLDLTKTVLAEKVWTHTPLRSLANGDAVARMAVELVFAELGIEELCASLAFDERYNKADMDYAPWMEKHLAECLGRRVFERAPLTFAKREDCGTERRRILEARALCITRHQGERR